MALGISVLMANPVDVNEAKALGQKFVDAHFEMSYRGLEMTLAYTANIERGEACFYVFNVGNDGFVILSADDFYRPIIGYSENGKFDYNAIPPALRDYLDGIVEARSMNRTTQNAAAPDVAADWRMLEKTGRLVSRHGGRGTGYFVTTKWDQSYPYNCCCPDDPAGSGGHAIVGCLATAMSQLMRFWAYPAQGQGSHCYYHEDYGEICADFGATTYDWDNMPNVLASSDPDEMKLATGTLCFHCGVSIDMGYGPDGSGGGSGGIPTVMHQYFNYCDAIVQLRRDDFETETWKSMVREQFDMGWPMYYGGCQDDGCHAFICDGYDDYDMFHFNLGWAGSSDGWYLIDDAPYTHPADAMFNYVPEPVYNATPSAPTNLVVTKASDTSFEATLTWTNPTTYLDGTPMTDIEKIVVMRNSKVCAEITTGIMPGQQMSCTDIIPYYDSFEYKVFAVSNGRNGKQALQQNVSFGPTCDWKVVVTTSNYNGWKGNHISIYNMANTEIGQVTMTSSAAQAIHVDVPVGRVYFGWTSSNDTIDDITFNIYNSQNVSVYSFSGSTADMPEGVFYQTNNNCGNSGTCAAPNNFTAVADNEDVVLEWDGSLANAYAYCIYRDENIYKMVTDNSQPYVDQETGGRGHCYNVSVLCENGESALSEMVCVSVGDACNPARHLWIDKQANGKPIVTWTAPANTEGLTGYYIYRKCNANGEYKLVKLVAANKYEFKENSSLENGNWYYYKVIAYYKDIECHSIPAQSLYGNDYFVKIYFSPESLDEDEAQQVEIYPNPAKDQLTIKAENIANVMMFNAVGQKVFEKAFDASEATINLDGFDTGIYMVKIVTDGEEVIRKVSVIK